MKFSGRHWRCIAREFPMLSQFVPLIFTLAHLFNVFFTGEGACPSPDPTPICEYTISGTPVLHELHWLPVHQRIRYKLAMTVYTCLHGLAPTYLAVDCLAISAIAGKRHLLSAGTGLLSVPRTRTKLGMRSFTVTGPVIRNSLPAALQTTTLPIVVHSTSEGPPVRLIDRVSVDHL